jgi:hypothetical protein
MRLALIAVVTFATVTASARASHVQCGDVITQDTTLDSDLLDCPSTGIAIGADGITLDLNGHTIDGLGSSAGGFGVVDTAGYDGVTVEHGTIQEFGLAAQFRSVTDSTFRGLTVKDVLTGLDLSLANASRIADNHVSALSNAILIWDDSKKNVVAGNVITNSGNGVLTGPFSTSFAAPEFTSIVSNVIAGNQYGVFASGLGITVERNSIYSNSEYGIWFLLAAGDGLVRRNDLAANGSGIALDASGRNMTIARNRIRGSVEYGLRVGPFASATSIERNVLSDNGEDGIDVRAPNTLLTRNTANFNGELGIEAVPGVSDGGGNKARGNGDPLQCLNIFCK